MNGGGGDCGGGGGADEKQPLEVEGVAVHAPPP